MIARLQTSDGQSYGTVLQYSQTIARLDKAAMTTSSFNILLHTRALKRTWDSMDRLGRHITVGRGMASDLGFQQDCIA